MLLAICVNTPIDHNVLHNLRAHVARCSASCVNWTLELVRSGNNSVLVRSGNSAKPSVEGIYTQRMPHHLVCSVFETTCFSSRLDIPALASLIGNILDERHYKTSSRHVRWSVDAQSSRMVSEKWIKLLWTFIHAEVDRLNEGHDYTPEELKVGVLCNNGANLRPGRASLVRVTPHSPRTPDAVRPLRV